MPYYHVRAGHCRTCLPGTAVFPRRLLARQRWNCIPPVFWYNRDVFASREVIVTDCPLTYGQCLRQVMERNGLSANTLSRKMGYHGTTQLARILRDEVSPALVTRFHQQFMLIFDWLISPGDIKALSTALQYTCLGPDSFLTRQAMHALAFEPSREDPQDIPIVIFPPPALRRQMTLQDVLDRAHACPHIELLVLGSAFDHLLPLFAGLAGQPGVSLRIRHVFILEDSPAQLVSQVAAQLPFLNVGGYEGSYFPASAREAGRYLRTHQIALLRAEHADGSIYTDLITPPLHGALNVCRLQGDNALFPFYEARLSAFSDSLRPIKAVYPRPDSMESLLTMCQRDLFLERNHACCFLRLDLCFHALPAAQVIDALDGGRALGLLPDAPLLQELLRVHEERYRNLLHKKEPTCFILSRPAMRSFMETGRLSDHFFAMRAFTPGERRTILSAFIDACRTNASLHVHLLREDAMAPVACFCGYADMGVQISDNHTTYDLRAHHGEAFISLPAFADALMAYCREALIPEACLSEAESLACLTAMLEEREESDA